jgi:hypothetical protein
MCTRSSMFWGVTQRRLVVCYRRFGTNYSPIFTGRSETFVTNYQFTLRNMPEEGSSLLQGGGTPKSRTTILAGLYTFHLRPHQHNGAPLHMFTFQYYAGIVIVSQRKEKKPVCQRNWKII